jgi:hypothetical protein
MKRANFKKEGLIKVKDKSFTHKVCAFVIKCVNTLGINLLCA